MKNPPPDFPPFTQRQLDLLEELRAEIEKLTALSALDPEVPKINKRIDELSVKALRFALKNLPKESRRPGFVLEVPTFGGRLLFTGEYEIKPGFGDFHQDLPPWAKNHFIEWIRYHRAGFRRYDGREVLRETGIVGIETGMKPPISLEDIERWELIKKRVLELRGVEQEGKQDNDLEHNDNDDLQHWVENRNRIKITPEMLKKACTKKETKRTRKIFTTWKMVIDKLVEDKLLPRKITSQAFKKGLKKHFSDYSWEKV
jgi:hypothetical protein